jgi:DMSO/TMAO reductase YedYZ molybdopterin-dependent catalytic subunit
MSAGEVWAVRSIRPTSPQQDRRTAAWLGLALGVTFGLCFATGVLSHLIQNPPGWFVWPPRPAGLYRITQSTHVITGFAAIPLVLAKLWVVYPKLWAWPPVRGVAHGLERLALLPLVGGALFLLVSGTLNVARWYPWSFFFPRTHYWAAWITMGALAVHIGAKATTAAAALRRAASGEGHPGDGDTPREPAVPERRPFLAGVAAATGLMVVTTAGGTVRWLSPVSVFAQRRPNQGPQGIPINKSAVAAGVVEAATDPGYQLSVEGATGRAITFSLDDLRALPQHAATLPIACVEGWSASGEWRGIRLQDLLDEVGAPDEVDVRLESLQPRGLYRASTVNSRQLRDRDTLLALELNGETLHLDHGYPVRLIGPNRPGVQQTKWVSRVVVI